MVRKMLITLIVILCIAQFFQIDKTNPPVTKSNEFSIQNNTPNAVKSILQSSCYDCHSNETKYPWYSYIVPLSYWLKQHINEGRAELNFSEWGTYSDKRKAKKIEECIEMIAESKMPPAYYTWMHKDAALHPSSSQLLLDYFRGLKFSNPKNIDSEKENDD
jgi:hypothetical protein